MNKVITDIATVIDSLHSTPEYCEAGFPMVRVVDVNNEFIKLDKCLKVDEDTFNKHNKNHIPQKGDIIITRVGSFGMLGYVETDKKFCLGQNIAIIHPYSKSKYLYYYLSSPFLKKKLYSKIGGSAYKCIGLDDIRKLPYYDSSLDTENIGNILFNLDSKIALNNRINAELEVMVKTVYDYWFVQFDFPFDFALGKPSAEGKPYKRSGGKMVWSEELKREVPEGWEVENIEKCCSIIDCLHSKKSDYFFEDENSYLLQLENILDNGLIDLTNKYFVTKNDYKNWTSRIEVKENDIVITNAGRVAVTAQIPKGIKTGIGRNITAIRPNSISPTYLFLSFRGIDMIRQIKWNTDSGAFFSSLNVKGIKQLYIVRPPADIETKFEKLVYNLRRKRELNQKENQQLSSLRDWLLPMLMNGQVKVGEQEEMEVERLMAAEPEEGYGK